MGRPKSPRLLKNASPGVGSFSVKVACADGGPKSGRPIRAIGVSLGPGRAGRRHGVPYVPGRPCRRKNGFSRFWCHCDRLGVGIDMAPLVRPGDAPGTSSVGGVYVEIRFARFWRQCDWLVVPVATAPLVCPSDPRSARAVGLCGSDDFDDFAILAWLRSPRRANRRGGSLGIFYFSRFRTPDREVGSRCLA